MAARGRNTLVKAVSPEGFVGIAVDATEAVEEARRRHHTAPTATAALGRTMVSAILLTSFLKDTRNPRIAVKITGDGPLKVLAAEADTRGRVRGYVDPAGIHLPPEGGKLQVGKAIGQGIFSVRRRLPNGEIYTSTVPLVSGEIGKDLAFFLHQSEQVPSAVALGVYVGTHGEVLGAGGVLVYLFPETPEAVITRLEANIRKLHSVSRAIHEGLTASGLLEEALAGTTYYPVFEKPVRFDCWCSRDSAQMALWALPDSDLQELKAEGGAEVVCRFCRKIYRFQPEELETLLRLRKHQA